MAIENKMIHSKFKAFPKLWVSGGLLFASAWLLAGCASQIPQAAHPVQPQVNPAEVLGTMERVADWQLAHPARHRTTDWTQGALYAGMMALDLISPSPRFGEAMRAIGESNQWKLGPSHYNADDHCVGQMYAELAMRYRDPRMIAPMRAQFDSIMAKPSSFPSLDFSRYGAGDRWSWCDSLFMAPPAWTRLASATGESKYLDYALTNWWITSEYLYEKEDHLFYRDSTYFARLEANGKRVFWGRGNGWVMGGLVRVLQDVPLPDPERAPLITQFREMAEKILTCQQADGLWRSSLLDPENYPLKETSGSGFYTYALAWGVNQGVLERERFGPAVLKAWRGLVDCVTPEGKLTHVQPIGADPKKFDVSHSDVYGVGAFLLAGSEVYRMLGGAVPSKPAGVVSIGSASPLNSKGAFGRVVSRYRQTIGRDPDRSLQDTGTIDLPQVKSWKRSCNSDGSWSDIDYQNQDRASWKACRHLDRLRLLTMAWADADGAMRGDKELETVIWWALDYWLAKGFTNPNWWWNQIGVPGKMCDIIVLLGDHLQGDRRAKALRILAQAGKPRSGGGANTLWIADLTMQYAALTANAALLKECRDIVSGEIKIGSGEGIQPDLSFHQHGARLQQFAYGRAYLMTAARAAWQLAETPWALPEDRLEILARFALEGDQWMCRGIDTVPSTLDRSVSRPNALKWGDIRSALEQLVEVLPARSAELKSFLARQNQQAEPLVGARAFPYSDFATYHRPGFSFFLKTLSNRTLTTETGLNSEHLSGHLQNLGDHYLLRDGEEYFNLSPVWNWDLLPGLTVAGSMAGPLPRPFTGTTTDGTSSASVMDYQFGTTNKIDLSARKLWVCHEDLIVALIGDLRFTGPQQARTVLDQCRLRAPVWVDDGAGPRELKPEGKRSGVNKWVYHSGFAYMPLEGRLEVRAETATGSWAKVNATLSPAPVSAPVLLVSMEHPQTEKPQNAGYVLAHTSKSEVEKLSREPTWEVLQNDSTAQVVRFNDGTVAAAFYEPCRLSFAGLAVAVDQTCLLLRRAGSVWLSDPSHQGLKLNLTLNKESRSCHLPADGTSVRWQ